ncbi:MAG: sodium:solute symporter family protein [Eubacteriales bacterium]|jgi:SSS family solute:Na+ symporter
MNIPLLIIIAYVLVLIGISWAVSLRGKKDGDSFLLYQGKNNVWVTAVTIAGMAIGGASTIGIAENAFSVGLSAGWYNVAWAIGAIVAGCFVVVRFRRSGHTTVAELVEEMYGRPTAHLTVFVQIVLQCTIIALQYIAGSSILASLLPDVFTRESGMLFSFLIFMVVALIGGMGSASLSNVLNVALIYIGVISAFCMVYFQAGGMDAVQTLAASEPQVPYLDFVAGMGPGVILAWIFVMITTCVSIQSVLQIGLTSRDHLAARKGYCIGAVLMIPIGFLCAMLGICAKVILPDVTATGALPQIILSLSPVVAGITLAGLWAADMSTACNVLIGCSTTVSRDVLARSPLRGLLQRNSLLVNKAIILILGLLTYLLSSRFGTILSALKVSSALTISTALVVMGGLLLPRLCSRSAGVGVILTAILSAVVWLACPQIQPLFGDVVYFMCATNLPVFVVLCLLDPRKVKVPAQKMEDE